MVFNCSTKPRITQSVKECLIDFDVNKHPNRRLLPKNKCGKQVVTGENNSVTYYGIGPCTLYIRAVWKTKNKHIKMFCIIYDTF